jgi:hypothetical protein
VVGHAGARLLADLAGATGLDAAFSQALVSMRQRSSGHDPGRVAVDVAVMLADGGEAICDLAVLRDQADLFGPVASDPTAWRVLAGIDADGLARLRQARAIAREVAWAQTVYTRGGGLPESTAAGRPIPGLVLDMDASIVVCHSEKQTAAATWKGSFGYHPLFCFLDATGEALAGMLRPGNAGSNTTADHITVLDDALAQIPDPHRHGTPILVRSDSAGCTKGLLAHIRDLRDQNVDARFSVGVAVTEDVRQAIIRAGGWIPAVDAAGHLRHGAEICELTGLVPDAGYPTGTRFIVRREKPLEDRIRTGKDTGFGRFPSRVFAINAAWLELALAGIDLLAWTRTLLLHGDLAVAEPKKLRYGCCTSLPGSPAVADEPGSGSPKSGPGQRIWSAPSTGSRRYPGRSPDPAAILATTDEPLEESGHRTGRAGLPALGGPSKSDNRHHDRLIVKDGG